MTKELTDKQLLKESLKKFGYVAEDSIKGVIENYQDPQVRKDNKFLYLMINSTIKHSLREGMYYSNPRKENVVADVKIKANFIYQSVLSRYATPRKYLGYTKNVAPVMTKYFIAEVTRLKAKVKPGCYPWLKRSNLDVNEGYERKIDWTGNDTDKYPKIKVTTVLSSIDVNWLYMTYDVEEIEYGDVLYYDTDPTYTQAIEKHLNYWLSEFTNAKPSTEEYDHAKKMIEKPYEQWGARTLSTKDIWYTPKIGNKTANLATAIYVTCCARVMLNKMMNRFYGQVVSVTPDSISLKLNPGQTKETIVRKLTKLGLYGVNEFGKWYVE